MLLGKYASNTAYCFLLNKVLPNRDIYLNKKHNLQFEVPVHLLLFVYICFRSLIIYYVIFTALSLNYILRTTLILHYVKYNKVFRRTNLLNSVFVAINILMYDIFVSTYISLSKMMILLSYT